jgi:leader peptidase (prepilin peptidase)/N-methyltransferase
MSALVAVGAVLGAAAGVAVQRAAARFVPARDTVPSGLHPADGSPAAAAPRTVSVRVPSAVPILATAMLWALATVRFEPTWQLPAFLFLAAVGVLLAVVDLEHRLLPNRILLPATGVAAALLTLAAAATGAWPHLLGAAVGAAALFLVFLVLALIAPAGLGMGDVKLAGLLGLYLGWLGAGAVVVGAVAGFVVQAVIALGLLAARRVGLRGEIPFGPAMLAGAALAIGAGSHWLGSVLGGTGRG